MSDAVNIAQREKLVDDALDIRKNCEEHRSSLSACECPFSVGGVCALHYGYPDQWPDMEWGK